MTRLFLTAITLTIMLLLLPTAQAADIETSGSCTLADAITAANADEAAGECPAGDGADIISLSDDITLTAALPQITTEITIEGNGFTISGNNRFRIFVVNGGTLTVNNLAMTKGNADWGGAIVNVNNGVLTINNSSITSSQAAEGGAIGNDGTLTITSSNISGNSADVGGAIHSVSGALSITDSTLNINTSEGRGGGIWVGEGVKLVVKSDSIINGNTSEGNGGGIYNDGGSVEVIDSAINNNSSGHVGGGIYCDFGSHKITNSTINGNSAENGGGGIDGFSCPATIINSIIINNSVNKGGRFSKGGGIRNHGATRIANSTIKGNSAELGGGIYNGSRTIAITNSIFIDNTAFDVGGGLYVEDITTLTHVTLVNNTAKRGSGIYREVDATLNLRNTIIVNNASGDCFGRLNENINNLIADGSCFAVLSGDPMLGELVEPEDGSPAYYPLLEGSPAIDAADDEYCPDTDMLGTARPQGAACDIGAYERPQ